MGSKVKVLYGATDFGASQFSADAFYKTGFKAPDPFFVFDIEGKIIIGTFALEVERAAKESHADEVVLLEQFRGEGTQSATHPALLFLQSRGVTHVTIPAVFPYALGVRFSEMFEVETGAVSLYAHDRAIKSVQEIGWIEDSQRACEHAVSTARSFLSECEIDADSDTLSHCSLNSPVDSNAVRKIIDDDLFAQGFLGVGTIVSCGLEAADPHAAGGGHLRPHVPIVLDVFPRSLSTLYFADQTRTFFKGEPCEEYKKIYSAVLDAQEGAISNIRDGCDGKNLFEGVCRSFAENGYVTDIATRPVQGFIHGLGHGVGIEIHEEPNLGSRSSFLREGMVVTVEPGLYYTNEKFSKSLGGIRIEDMVLVTKNGHRNLTNFPKKLSDAILD